MLTAIVLPLSACMHSASPDAPPPSSQSPSPGADRLTLVVTGDLMVHEEQLLQARSEHGFDFSHAFAEIEIHLREGDLTAGNLETVLGGGAQGYSGYPLFNAPDEFARSLAQSGFHFLTTANNHCLDQGEEGLLRTLRILDQQGIRHTGTFSSPEERSAPFILEIKGYRVVLLSYTFGTNGIPLPGGREYRVSLLEEAGLLADLQRAKALQPDLLVVFPHMGEEYAAQPDSRFRQIADLMIDHGADLVLASHPHVLQPMEVKQITDLYGITRQAFVIYSLGNALSSQRDGFCDTGILLKLDFVREGGRTVLDQVRFVPTWVQFRDRQERALIRVLPLGGALQSYHSGNPMSLHPQDLDRAYKAHAYATGLYLGQPVPAAQVAEEYLFYSRRENA